ncbi:14172_t:CDS:2 [Ambispora leptoticha]|uniref:U6 snRNA phosphodiesterase 1 n=1 Tax=Ambispora leptoticha TaxID=144679 RepID=A0A9N9B6Q8_9GLOM|nr:14172_t:CDS:2 [Ambispora leptoticha]
MNGPLVDYSSAEESGDSKEENEVGKFSSGKLCRSQEEEEENKESRKKKQVDLPPLPNEFLELFTGQKRHTVNKKEIDTTKKHEDRIRTVSHVEGNWATHVFVDVKIDRDFENIIQKIKNKVQKIIAQEGHDFKIYSCFERNEDKGNIEEETLESKLPEENEVDALVSSSSYPSYTLHEAITDDDDTKLLHISLSRPIFLKYHQINSFWGKIRSAVQDSKRFSLSFAKIEYFVNDEKTRSFLALEVGKGYNEIPRFHASILWWSPRNTTAALCDSIVAAAAANEDEIREEIFIIDGINCKIGNKEFTQILV